MRTELSASIKFGYPVIVRITSFIGITLLILVFLVFPRVVNRIELEEEVQIIIEQIDIPQTEQFDRPPPPARPSVPVESESEDIADDVTLDEFNLDDFDAWDAPPPPPEGPRVKFIPYDDPPVPLSPIRPKYPEIAQEAGIEGTVVIQVFIDKKGRVKETVVLKGIPNTGLDEAATSAIRKVRFRPAKQRERAVGVWISIPVNFRLKS
ncbi:energy transducer TonB [Candidatus Marinimicrobia bacterium]|jgi:protein TonB|nr:energy transducer TonB [Candidatus Neomarinimicrobiota bacterium]|tara:strand:- start:109 stop:732 length:624 start_codon:yes stop_codon:yes gene_type:complete